MRGRLKASKLTDSSGTLKSAEVDRGRFEIIELGLNLSDSSYSEDAIALLLPLSTDPFQERVKTNSMKLLKHVSSKER